jgi:transcriptional regulator with XRE-family HTH domain
MARENKSDMSIVLRYLRETLGWSQVHLEKTAGLPAHAVNDYESGQKKLRRGKLEVLIGHMGLGPARIDAALADIDPGLLNPALLPWVEAALHRDERELPQALKKIGEALAALRVFYEAAPVVNLDEASGTMRKPSVV